MKSILFLLAIIPMLIVATTASVSATGIRYDSGDDTTDEEHGCWIDGYDSGFAGKYDKDRARECVDHDDNYNKMWAYGCEDSPRTEEECGELINNPVETEDFEALKAENDRTCNDAGRDDGKAGVYNEERNRGCYEFENYKDQFQLICETHTTESSCELMYEDKQYYCPKNPDVGGCAEFLHNATNKKPEPATCVTFNASASCFSYQEDNPERYCLSYDSPRCKEIGDICDDEGFVRPEYPYCKGD